MKEYNNDTLTEDILEMNEAEEIKPEIDEDLIYQENDDINEEMIDTLLICDECTNQWEDIISRSDEENLFCPMCGSSSVVMI